MLKRSSLKPGKLYQFFLCIGGTSHLGNEKVFREI